MLPRPLVSSGVPTGHGCFLGLRVPASGTGGYFRWVPTGPGHRVAPNPSTGELFAWHTCTSMKTRLRRGYIGNALNAGGNRRLCILERSSSLSICAQMNIAGAPIAGSSTGTAHALEPHSELKRELVTKRKGVVARSFSRNNDYPRPDPRECPMTHAEVAPPVSQDAR